VSSHCSAPCLLTTHHHHLAPRWLCQPDHAHLASNHVNPPPCKCNPQINPAPRINHHTNRISPRKCPNRWNPAPRPIDEDPVPLGKQQEIQHPPCSQVCTPHLPTNQPQMTAKMLVPSVTRAPLCPTRPWPPRPHVDTQMHPNSAIDSEDSWWVHSRVSKRSCDVAPSLRIYIQLDV